MNILSRMRGVTLIELAVTLSVLALAVTLAVPSWQQLRQKRDVTATAEGLAAFLLNIQSSAVLHNNELTVSLMRDDSTHWCLGAALGAVACDCSVSDPDDPSYCSIVGAKTVITPSPSSVSRMTGHGLDTAFTFEPTRGLMIDEDLRNPHFFDLVSKDSMFGLRVSMHPTGSVQVCNFDLATPVPGYDACPAAPIIIIEASQ